MKSTWDKIFSSNNTVPLSEQECEQALQEVAEAVAEVGRMRELPEHERIRKQIAAKMAGNNHQPTK